MPIDHDRPKSKTKASLQSYQFLISDANCKPDLKPYRVYIANGFNAVIIRVFSGENLTDALAIPFEDLLKIPVNDDVLNRFRNLYSQYAYLVE